VEQELLTLLEHLGSPPGLSGIYVARSFSFLCNVLFIGVCPFYFGHCVVY
jgi:hypothetical protein